MKDFDSLLKAAFMAGVEHRSKRPTERGSDEDAYHAWRGRWAGRPHEGLPDAVENRPCGQAEQRQAEQYAAMAQETLGTRMGHPGGHYGN